MLLRQSRCGLSWLWAHWLLLLMMLLLMPLLLTVYSTHWRWGGFCSVSFMCLQFSARPHDKCSIVPAAGVGLSCLLLLFLCFPLKCDCASSAATLLLGWQEQHLVCSHPAVSSMHRMCWRLDMTVLHTRCQPDQTRLSPLNCWRRRFCEFQWAMKAGLGRKSFVWSLCCYHLYLFYLQFFNYVLWCMCCVRLSYWINITCLLTYYYYY